MAADKPDSELTRLRGQIERIRDELTALDEISYPLQEWRARAHEWIARQSADFEKTARFAFSALRTPLGGHQPRVGAFELSVLPSPGGRDFAHVDVSGALCWLLRDVLIEKIDALVAESEHIPTGPPSSERPARRLKLTDQLATLEAREELAIRVLEDAGRQIARRPDARPELVLAWQDDLEARAGGKQP